MLNENVVVADRSKLEAHEGCFLEIVTYGDPIVGWALECNDHNEVLMDWKPLGGNDGSK